jgi:hypothetical protein
MAKHLHPWCDRIYIRRVFTLWGKRTHIPTPPRWDEMPIHWTERLAFAVIYPLGVGTSYRYAGRAR